MDEDHDQAVSNVPLRIGRAGSGNYDDDGENERLVMKTTSSSIKNDNLITILHQIPSTKL